jgi:hypothetical protein
MGAKKKKGTKKKAGEGEEKKADPKADKSKATFIPPPEEVVERDPTIDFLARIKK